MTSQDPSAALLDRLRSLPMLDDNVFLLMQAQQAALLDGHIRSHEDALLEQWIEKEKFPAADSMYLVAISQCWIFAVYELLRTWRQLATEVVNHADACSALGGGADSPLKMEALRASKSASLPRPYATEELHEHMYVQHLRRAEGDAAFAKAVRDAKARLEPAFRQLEALRVTLAKQEVPRAGKGTKAYMPAYTRGDQSTGSMVWPVEYKDGNTEFVARRAIADELSAGE